MPAKIAMIMMLATQLAAAADGPATAPAEKTYENAKAGVKLRYPADWQTKASKDYTLLLFPAASANASADSPATVKIDVDVPDLPFHLPGMITIDRVVNGYIDDQKDRFVDLKVVEKTDQAVADAKAKKIVLSGHLKNADKSAGPACTVITYAEIHADRVYLISAESSDDKFAAVRVVFDKLFATVQWMK